MTTIKKLFDLEYEELKALADAAVSFTYVVGDKRFLCTGEAHKAAFLAAVDAYRRVVGG